MAMLTIGGGSEAVRDFVSAVIATEDVQSMYTFVADDFNGITYKVMQNPGEPTKFRMEARFANLADIFAAGGKEVLDSDYAGLVGDADGENTVALDVDLNGTLPCPKDELADRLSMLGRNLVGAPILLALRALKAGNLAETAPKKIVTNSTTGACMFVSTTPTKVRVVYAMNFEDASDAAVARVVLQELAEARGSPSTQYADTCDLPGAPPSNVGYMTIAVNSRQDLEKSVTQLVYFPSYLDYHVKATKAFLHSRMRNRVGELLKVVNRARPELVKKSEGRRTSKRRSGAGAGAGAGVGAGAGAGALW